MVKPKSMRFGEFLLEKWMFCLNTFIGGLFVVAVSIILMIRQLQCLKKNTQSHIQPAVLYISTLLFHLKFRFIIAVNTQNSITVLAF